MNAIRSGKSANWVRFGASWRTMCGPAEFYILSFGLLAGAIPFTQPTRPLSFNGCAIGRLRSSNASLRDCLLLEDCAGHGQREALSRTESLLWGRKPARKSSGLGL